MTSQSTTISVVLASSSSIRRKMLQNAGVNFIVKPAIIDEEVIRHKLLRTKPDILHSDIALILAEEKAKKISLQFSNSLVIGCDQILSTGSEIFSKPETLSEARKSLEKLRGRTHHLHSGVVLSQNGQILWGMVDTAILTMHSFSDTFLERYLKDAGESILGCVGAYQLEGAGIRLFENIQGDYYTMLGLPLLPLLRELRKVLGNDI